MNSAYVMEKKPVNVADETLGVPEKRITKTGLNVFFDRYKDQVDFESLFIIFKDIVTEGLTYPQDTVTKDSFRSYFLSDHCFVIRLEDGQKTVAAVYIKPNFPGRSSHICNGGLIVSKEYRNSGLGHILMEKWIELAPKLGFKACYTNLVYENNQSSLKLCLKYGLEIIGRLPKAGLLANGEYVDAFQLYKEVGN